MAARASDDEDVRRAGQAPAVDVPVAAAEPIIVRAQGTRKPSRWPPRRRWRSSRWSPVPEPARLRHRARPSDRLPVSGGLDRMRSRRPGPRPAGPRREPPSRTRSRPGRSGARRAPPAPAAARVRAGHQGAGQERAPAGTYAPGGGRRRDWVADGRASLRCRRRSAAARSRPMPAARRRRDRTGDPPGHQPRRRRIRSIALVMTHLESGSAPWGRRSPACQTSAPDTTPPVGSSRLPRTSGPPPRSRRRHAMRSRGRGATSPAEPRAPTSSSTSATASGSAPSAASVARSAAPGGIGGDRRRQQDHGEEPHAGTTAPSEDPERVADDVTAPPR